LLRDQQCGKNNAIIAAWLTEAGWDVTLLVTTTPEDIRMPNFMPVISPEELTKRRSAKATRVDLTPYLDYLRTISPGSAGELQLYSSENKPTIKRRLTMAANRLGKVIKYLRSGENQLVFEVLSERKG
jgi:hypothetical protein